MALFTADPFNPRGRRSGSLAGSGTHDEDSIVDATGVHDLDAGCDTVPGTAQAAGDGATEFAAWLAAREEFPHR
jgi:hypothetical protein